MDAAMDSDGRFGLTGRVLGHLRVHTPAPAGGGAGLGRGDCGRGLGAEAGTGGWTRHLLCGLGESLGLSEPQLSFGVVARGQCPLGRVSGASAEITHSGQ